MPQVTSQKNRPMKSAAIYKINLFGFLLIGLFFMPFRGSAFQKRGNEEGVVVLLNAASKKASFSARKPIRFKVSIKNNFTNDQEGTLVYTVKNNSGETILRNSLDVRVNARKKIESSFEVPLDTEGEYTLNANIELNDHAELITREFSYSGPPRKANDRRNIPNPYDQNWSRDNIDQSDASTREALVAESDKEVATEEAHGEEESEEEGEIITKVKPYNADGLFYNGKNIRYTVTLINKYKAKQEGTFKLIVKTEEGKPVGETVVNIKMGKKGIRKFTVKLPEITQAGVYNIDAALNVSTYDDTTKHAFGYRINNIATPYHLAPDFDEFWKTARNELAAIDPQYRIIPDESKSTYFHTVYRVEFQSLGNVPVFGWLSIPKPKGKYPVLIGFGGYKIELSPLYFDDFISFTVNVRGIDKKVKEQINPENREQLLVNIENKDDYIYRGIYMDCIRAVEFIHSHGDMGMDLRRVVAFGGSQGASLSLIAAAMMPDKINTVVANNPIFFDWARHVEITQSNPNIQFPIRDLRRFQDKNPEMTIDNMVHTLQYFEVQNFMPAVACPVLYAVSLLDEFVPPGTALAAYNKMSPETIAKSELYVFPTLGHEVPRSHDAFVSKWFLEKVVKKRKSIRNEFGNQ